MGSREETQAYTKETGETAFAMVSLNVVVDEYGDLAVSHAGSGGGGGSSRTTIRESSSRSDIHPDLRGDLSRVKEQYARKNSSVAKPASMERRHVSTEEETTTKS